LAPEEPEGAEPSAAANGGGPSRLPSARLVAAVAELGSLAVVRVHPEEQSFRDLCADIHWKTERVISLRDCEPEFQRALDYILAHPEHRELYAAVLRDMVHYRVGSHYLLGYCMRTLRWPEVADTVRQRMAEDIHNSEYESLREVLSYDHDG